MTIIGVRVSAIVKCRRPFWRPSFLTFSIGDGVPSPIAGEDVL